MNIEQLQKDRQNGVIVSRSTFDKLIEAAHEMELALNHIRSHSVDMDIVMVADEALALIKNL